MRAAPSPPQDPSAATGRPASAVVTLVALLALAAANAWIGERTPELLDQTSVGYLTRLDQVAEAYPRERVRVLVLGNSQAVAGFRPPILSEGLGLGRDGVFSLALVGAAPQEMRLLLERHLPRFPNVTHVVVGVNESFLTRATELRTRWLTMGRLDQRLQMCEDQPLEHQLRLLAGTWLPALDFGQSLRDRFVSQPRTTLAALRPPAARPASAAARAFPWGLEPQWDRYSERDFREARILSRQPRTMAWRAATFTRDLPYVARSARQLGRLTRDLRARGIQPLLVELPYTRALAAVIARAAPGARAWRTALDDLPPEERAPRLAAPDLPDEAFYDADHLNPAGARRIAAAIAQAVGPLGGP